VSSRGWCYSFLNIKEYDPNAILVYKKHLAANFMGFVLETEITTEEEIYN